MPGVNACRSGVVAGLHELDAGDVDEPLDARRERARRVGHAHLPQPDAAHLPGYDRDAGEMQVRCSARRVGHAHLPQPDAAHQLVVHHDVARVVDVRLEEALDERVLGPLPRLLEIAHLRVYMPCSCHTREDARVHTGTGGMVGSHASSVLRTSMKGLLVDYMREITCNQHVIST